MSELEDLYTERAHLIAALAAMYPAVKVPADDVDEDGWWIIYLYLGYDQASWHISPRDAYLIRHVTPVEPDDERARWDGHTTAEKYGRIRNLIRALA